MSEKNLTPDSSIKDIFEAVMPEEGMRVVPTQIPAPEGKAYLAILLAGTAAEANVLMANLMTYVQEMHEVAQQKAADEKEKAIVGANGEPLEDEPAIIVP